MDVSTDLSWTTAPTYTSVVTAQQANFLQDLSNAAQASEQNAQTKDVTQLSDTAQSFLGMNTSVGSSTNASFYGDPYRGQNLDITI